MKNKFKIYKIMLLGLFALSIGCSKDSYNIQESQKDKSTIVSQRTITGTEALAIGEKLSSSLSSITGKTVTNYGTIDYSEIKNVINSNGKENYTFRITNHPESSETVFFNLVMTQREGYTTVMLVKYEMDAAFTEAYYTRSKEFTQFSGTVSTSLVSSNDPCPPVVVPPTHTGGSSGGDSPDPFPDQGSGGVYGEPDIPRFLIISDQENGGNSGTGTTGTGTGTTGTGTTTTGTGTNGCHCTHQGSNFKIASNNENDAEDPCPKDNAAGILSPEAYESFYNFFVGLPDDVENWLRKQPNQVSSLFFHYLYDNGFSDDAKLSATQMIDALTTLPVENQAELTDITKAMIYANENNYLNQNLDDAFFQHMATVSSTSFIDPNTAITFARLFLTDCALIKQENPTWPFYKVFGQAYLDTMHLLLDIGGLVPVFGEVFDIGNGVIYTVQGDGLNASLSYASAIPIAGWFSSGIKFAKRTINIAGGAKTTLKWIVNSSEVIKFGERSQLRKVIGLAVGDARQAHHIIPWAKSNHSIIQKAAESANAFHMNSVLNGIPLDNAVHYGSHTHYDNLIVQKMDDFMDEFPNATPDQCYNGILDIINDVKSAISTHPNTPINQLNF